MKIQSESGVELLSTETREFAGRDGKTIKYTTAQLVTPEGKVLTVQADLHGDIPNRSKGICVFEMYMKNTKDGKSYAGSKLIDFIVQK
jgi:hypothetical protein